MKRLVGPLLRAARLRGVPSRVRSWAERWAGSELGATIARDDALTIAILTRSLGATSTALDVGCNAGQILEHIVRLAPRGRHYAFEPIPALAADVQRRFPGVKVMAVALSNERGESTFHHVVNDPGYSGLRRRRYDRPDPQVELIQVRTERLDDVIPPDAPVDFIKIDVEGAELLVLEGARRTLRERRPRVVFEHGRGASDHYGTTPERVHALLTDECGLAISTLSGFLEGAPPLGPADLRAVYEAGTQWNFVAHPA